jgi:hypothetical protein
MSLHETHVAIATALVGLVLATGIGAVATPPAPTTPVPATQVTATQPVDVAGG